MGDEPGGACYAVSVTLARLRRFCYDTVVNDDTSLSRTVAPSRRFSTGHAHMDLKRTVLYDTHVALGAKMVEFSGWEMPVQVHKGILDEHRAVRTAAGLFDIDHMGQVRVTGSDALAYLNHLLTANFSDMEVNTAKYAVMCYADGTCVDDTFVYRLEHDWMVVVNAGNREKDILWMIAQANAQAQAPGFDVTLVDVSDEFYMLAFQGPKAEEVLQRLESFDLSELKYHQAREFHIHDARGILARRAIPAKMALSSLFLFRMGSMSGTRFLRRARQKGLCP